MCVHTSVRACGRMFGVGRLTSAASAAAERAPVSTMSTCGDLLAVGKLLDASSHALSGSGHLKKESTCEACQWDYRVFEP